jgi:hypothetical protein
VIKLLSRRVFASLEDFGDFVASGGMAAILEKSSHSKEAR